MVARREMALAFHSACCEEAPVGCDPLWDACHALRRRGFPRPWSLSQPSGVTVLARSRWKSRAEGSQEENDQAIVLSVDHRSG